MKQYTFKDGTKVIASSVEEAKSKHKVLASIEFGYGDEKALEKFFGGCKRCTSKIGKKIATLKGKDINITITRVNKRENQPHRMDYCQVDVTGKIGDNKISMKKEYISDAIRQLQEEINYLKGTGDNLSRTMKELGFKKTFDGWENEKYNVYIEKVNSKKCYVELRNPLFKDTVDGMTVAPSGVVSAIAKLAKKLVSKSKENLKTANELYDLVSE